MNPETLDAILALHGTHRRAYPDAPPGGSKSGYLGWTLRPFDTPLPPDVQDLLELGGAVFVARESIVYLPIP